MLIHFDQETFSEAVTWVAKTLPINPTTPALSGLLIEAHDKTTVNFSVFNYDVSSFVSINADVQKKGQILISGKLLSDISRFLPTGKISFELKENKIYITTKNIMFALPLFSLDEYPKLPNFPKRGGIIKGKQFVKAINRVYIAASKDDSLAMLTGIKMEVTNNSITFVATDRYRLAIQKIPFVSEINFGENTMVPARILHEVAKTIKTTNDVKITISEEKNENLIGFQSANHKTNCRLLDTEFPKYQSLIPENTTTQATLDTHEMIEALKRVSLVAQRNIPIRVKLENNKIILHAGSNDNAIAEQTVEAEINGNNLEIAFNPQFLLEGFQATSSTQQTKTVIAFTEPTKPAVLYLAEEKNKEEDYKYIIMPVRLTG